MALGCEQGVLEVCDFPSLQPCFRERLSKTGERLSVLCFSGCGSFLAAASWDQQIYLLKLSPSESSTARRVQQTQVRLHRVLQGNSSSPVALMFSADSQYVMSNSKDTQILHWSTKDGSLQRSISAFRDTKWQPPWTAVFGWPVIGVWGDPDYDGTDVNSACQAYGPEKLLAFGDDHGRVRLIRFPSPFLEPAVKGYTGHGSHVTAVKFSRTNVLASLGGDDHSIGQWSLINKPSQVLRQAAPHLKHPWVELEGSDAPQDRFNFIGRPRPLAARASSEAGNSSRPPSAPPGRPSSAQRFNHNRSNGVGSALRWD